MTRSPSVLFSLTAIVACLAACAAQDGPWGSDDSLQGALEEEDGGLGADDEEPLFGDPSLFEEAGLAGEDPAPTDDELALGPDGSAHPRPGPNALSVLILWGQLRPSGDRPEPTVWDGSVAVTAGGLAVRRVIRFEGRSDELMPRPNRQAAVFRSATGPHNDGLLVSLVRPELDPAAPGATDGEAGPAAGDGSGPLDPNALPPSLSFQSAALDEPVIIPIPELLHGFRALIDVDDMGNQILITAAPEHPCAHGMTAGIWSEVRPGLGTLVGRWQGAGGELDGHLRGIYGINRAGERRFFAKYISQDGRFRGIVRGTYGDGAIEGRWVDERGRHRGGVRGHYAAADDSAGEGRDSVFAAHWVEACGAGEPRCEPGSADCGPPPGGPAPSPGDGEGPEAPPSDPDLSDPDLI